MSHIRHCRISRNQVIVAENRLHKPDHFTHPEESRDDTQECPFEKGNESLTPSEIERLNDDSGAWMVRVVPNLYNALSIEEEKHTRRIGFFEEGTGLGAHEVVIETPEHDKRFSRFERREMGAYLSVLISRLKDLRKDSRLEYIQIFKNSGPQAGASVVHPHSQVIATAFIPADIRSLLENMQHYYREHGRALMQDMVAEEIRLNERIVYENRTIVAFAPYASFFPFEVMLVPKAALNSLTEFSKAQQDDLAEALITVFSSMDRELGDFAYNMAFFERPAEGEIVQDELLSGLKHYFRFYIRIMPRIYQLAGYEVSTGVHINPVAPEMAAARLKEVRR